ncbi:AAA family ATPase [Mucilaginibacter lappiensis]|uniref:Chromosome partitioning protein n=1 Tax=Mucilaginibacter lappiensis TaxID=354630 RepID=A0A841JTC6_9SPHI|nr:AAA family ATPase [Mucilaginibacter lappiensis]MBB6131535.1 chromosome partitioning protein [Mucilaginibacter lappiensis]
MIYVFGGIKGGVGKTTVALNFVQFLAGGLQKDVLLIDADDQETATDYTAWRDSTLDGQLGYTAVKITGDAIRSQMPNLKKKYDDIIIDTGGRDTRSQRAALTVADVYLIPFYPRSFDFWTVTKVQHLINEIKIVNPKLKAITFLNRADIRSADNRDTATALEEAEGITYFNFPLLNRKCFSNAAGKGLSVFEFEPKDEKAINELNALFEEIIKLT